MSNGVCFHNSSTMHVWFTPQSLSLFVYVALFFSWPLTVWPWEGYLISLFLSFLSFIAENIIVKLLWGFYFILGSTVIKLSTSIFKLFSVGYIISTQTLEANDRGRPRERLKAASTFPLETTKGILLFWDLL